MKMKHLRRIVLAACVLTSLTACTSSDATPTSRNLTQQEAADLAQSINLNYVEGGAKFVVSTVIAPGQGAIQLAGTIDWKSHVGSANVSASVADSTLQGVVWGTNAIAESRPAFEAQLSTFGRAKPYFIVRKPNMNRRLDQIVAVVMGLAAEQPENSQLILQKPGSMYLREDVLRNEAVRVLRYGERNVFWIAKDSGLLLRFEGSNELGNQPIIIDFSDHGIHKVGFPAQVHLVDAEAHEDVMQMTSGF